MWAWKVRGKFEGGENSRVWLGMFEGVGFLRCVGFCGSASWALFLVETMSKLGRGCRYTVTRSEGVVWLVGLQGQEKT